MQRMCTVNKGRPKFHIKDRTHCQFGSSDHFSRRDLPIVAIEVNNLIPTLYGSLCTSGTSPVTLTEALS